MRSRPGTLLVATGALALAAALVVVASASRDADSDERSREFQRLVGGLGAGPALDLGDAPSVLDPRLDSSLPAYAEPLPAPGTGGGEAR